MTDLATNRTIASTREEHVADHNAAHAKINELYGGAVRISQLGSLIQSLGLSGVDGKSITTALVNEAGRLVLNLSDGSNIDVGVVVGAQGPQGPQGTTGATGAAGSAGSNGTNGTNGVSVTGATVNGSGHLILTLSNSTTIDAGKVRNTARIFSAEDDFGFVGDNSTDNLAAWNAMWTTLVPGDIVKFGAGIFRFSGRPVMKKSGITIEGVNFVYSPYQISNTSIFGTVFRPSSSAYPDASLLHFPDAADNGNVEVDNCTVRKIVFNGNSIRGNGSTTDIHGITMQGVTKAHVIEQVTLCNTSGHGIWTTLNANGDYPRLGIFDKIVVWSAGNLGTGTAWGINFEVMTDCKVSNLLVVDCEGGGVKWQSPGQVTASDWHIVFNHGVGVYFTGTSGNGGFTGTNINTDRNWKQGLLIDAQAVTSGRQLILISNSHFRRDGGNNEVAGGTYAAIDIGVASGTVCPVRLNNVAVTVYRSDTTSNTNYQPYTAINIGSNISTVDIDGEFWGQTNAITGTYTGTGGKVQKSATCRFYTGNPTGARTAVNPTVS